MSRRELPATAFALLGLLVFPQRDDAGVTGYELKQRADNTLRYYWVAPAMSQIYTELRRLAERGFVAAVEGEDRAATRYRITDAGETALREWLFARDPGFPVLKHPVALRLLMGSLSSDAELIDMLERHLADLEQRSGELGAVRAMLGDQERVRHAALVAEWGLEYYASEKRIVAGIIERLRSGS